jgi:hypothetical protein
MQIASPDGHPALHRRADMLQPLGTQLMLAGVRQVPCPSQVAAAVNVSPTQLASAQIVPAG